MRTISLSILLLVSLLAVPTAAQHSQPSDAAPTLAKPPFDPAANAPRPLNTGQLSTPTSAAAHKPMFWRVGTRRCGQTFETGIGCCRLTAEMCDSCGRCRATTVENMLASLQPGVPICVFIHGSQVNEPTSRVESAATYRWLKQAAPGYPIQMIAFDWPSDTHIGLFIGLDFIKLGRQAARNGFPLAQLVQRLPVESPVCLLGHSHGARAAVAATHLLAGGSVQGYRLQRPDQAHRVRLVLAAAAVDHDWLNPGQRYDCAIRRAECVVNMTNCLDYALVAYPARKVIGVRALGQSGFTSFDVRRLGSNARKVSELDVNPIVGARHDWPNYYREPQIGRAISGVVFFSDLYDRR